MLLINNKNEDYGTKNLNNKSESEKNAKCKWKKLFNNQISSLF